MQRRTCFPLIALACAALAAFGCRAPQAQEAAPSPREQFAQFVKAGKTPVDLKPRVVTRSESTTTRLERVRLTMESGEEAVAVLYLPKAEGKHPVVIVQHFLGASKDSLPMVLIMGQLAQRGFIAVGIDGRFRGERQNGKTLEAAMVEALKTGKGRPFLIDTVYDVTRLVDYLVTRPDVDRDRIGMTGLSEGGIITWMAAAMEPRLRAAAPVIGVTCFDDAFKVVEDANAPARLQLFDAVLKEHAMQLGEAMPNSRVLRSALEKLVPGLFDRFDATRLVPEIAPRPLLILSHENDELFPLEGARKVHAAAQPRYKAENAEDRLEHRISPMLKHNDVNLMELTEMAAWLEKWLKG